MPPPPATPAPRAASCFAKEAVRQGRPEPPPPPFQPHPSLRLRQTKGGVLRSHQPSRTQEFLIGGKVGGVGLAMMMLIAARIWLVRQDGLSHGVKLGVEFWATMYIPIVVAMAAQQNVVAAARGGPIVLIAGLGAVSICFACVALISRFGDKRELPPEEVAEIERGGYVIGGDTPPDYAGPAPGREPALATPPVSAAKA